KRRQLSALRSSSARSGGRGSCRRFSAYLPTISPGRGRGSSAPGGGPARAGLERARARAVEGGDEASLPLLLRYLSLVELLSGDWDRAERYAEEGYDAALQTGQPSQQAVLAGSRALVAAHTGDVEAAHATAEEALSLADSTGSGF